MQALLSIQKELKVSKDKYNKFGGFKYRNANDILAAVKPLLFESNSLIYFSEDIVLIGDWHFVKCTLTFEHGDFKREVVTIAKHAKEEPKFKDAQISGSTISYVRKYALAALFLIDDEVDLDSVEDVPTVPIIQAPVAPVQQIINNQAGATVPPPPPPKPTK